MLSRRTIEYVMEGRKANPFYKVNKPEISTGHHTNQTTVSSELQMG